MAIKLGKLAEIRLAVEPRMDPRLQRAQHRKTRREFAVAARVTSVREWQRTPHVIHRSVLGKARRGGFIVTGRIDVACLSHVRNAPCVLSLKASRPLRPQLDTTLASMRVRPDLLPRGVQPKGGAGVVVGIIDLGGDFAHPNFRDRKGRTRLLSLWHQEGKTRRGDDVQYGRSFSRKAIDKALKDKKAKTPYHALGYRPYDDPKGAHGTHVMDIAAGNGLGTRQAGIAPQADLVFVDISQKDLARDGVAAAGSFMGDSVMALEALDYVFRHAGRRPCVVNLSLGSTGGPHDGSSLVEQGIDALVQAKPNRAVVVAAGNFQIDGTHARGSVAAGATATIKWSVPAGGEMECWYDGNTQLEATLIGPRGRVFGPVVPGRSAAFGIGRKAYVFIANRVRDPNNGQNQLDVWLDPDLPAGDWRVRLRSRSRKAVAWHAWIERDATDPASFDKADPSHTLGSLSTGFDSIAVGAYDAHVTGFPLSPKSSSGATRDGRRKPELSAPGHDVHAARAFMSDTLVPRSGTSMAAPAVTGLIALIYAQARRNGRALTIAQLRARLLRGLDRAPGGRNWDPRYGFGRASAKAIKK